PTRSRRRTRTCGERTSYAPHARLTFLPLRLQVQEQDAPVRMLVRSRLRIRIALRHPAGYVLGVVLVPVDALRDRNHRDEVDHHRLELLDDRVLRRGARGSAVLVDERVRLWIGIALPV